MDINPFVFFQKARIPVFYSIGTYAWCNDCRHRHRALLLKLSTVNMLSVRNGKCG